MDEPFKLFVVTTPSQRRYLPYLAAQGQNSAAKFLLTPMPALSGTPGQRRRLLAEQLQQCDGIVVFVDQTLVTDEKELRPALGLVKTSSLACIGLVVGRKRPPSRETLPPALQSVEVVPWTWMAVERFAARLKSTLS
jgi:hypothetical protein